MTDEERVRRFETAYNRIDRALEDLTQRGDSSKERRRTYASKVRIAANRVRRLARHVDFLLEVGELRNAIVHNRLGDGSYIAVPNEQTVLELETIEKRLFSPEKVVPRFQRTVQSLQVHDSLALAWELVRSTGFTRFPVYENGSFIGLLTSNGFTRWCAGAMDKKGQLTIDTHDVQVRDVMATDHHREFAALVAVDATIDEVAELFRENALLEAVIVTQHGRATEKPIGLICASDILSSSSE
ncbi:MAG: CBS domain-containing protein [Phycisphaerales bacterium]